jgi:hypothetical protein
LPTHEESKEEIMIRLLALGCLIVGLVGCGVVPPRVQYTEYSNAAVGTDASDASGYQFRQRRSVIVLEYSTDAKGFRATAVPYELTTAGSYSTLYRVWGADDYKSTTQLKVSYVDNTKFMDQLQVTTKDNIADTISKIGDIAKLLAPMVPSFVAEKEAPAGPPFVKTMVDPAQAGIDQWTKDPLNKDYCVRLKDVVCESTLSLKQYVADGLGKWRSTFPVPACATGVVQIASPCNDDNIKFSNRITFADADKVLPMGLPSTGSLKMNSVCGASVTEADKQDRQSLLDYLSKAITGIQGVSGALKQPKTGTATTEKPKTGK